MKSSLISMEMKITTMPSPMVGLEFGCLFFCFLQQHSTKICLPAGHPDSPESPQGRVAVVNQGLDFAFPVTPTAQDPSAVFSTWTHIRSSSISNASDFSGFSPHQSPERGEK